MKTPRAFNVLALLLGALFCISALLPRDAFAQAGNSWSKGLMTNVDIVIRGAKAKLTCVDCTARSGMPLSNGWSQVQVETGTRTGAWGDGATRLMLVGKYASGINGPNYDDEWYYFAYYKLAGGTPVGQKLTATDGPTEEEMGVYYSHQYCGDSSKTPPCLNFWVDGDNLYSTATSLWTIGDDRVEAGGFATRVGGGWVPSGASFLHEWDLEYEVHDAQWYRWPVGSTPELNDIDSPTPWSTFDMTWTSLGDNNWEGERQ